jgi:glucose/arabinose dehydrogenase
MSSIFTKKVYSLLFVLVVFIFTNTWAQPTLSFTQLADGLSGPLDIKNAGDGSDRLFIVEQGGLIKIYKKGKILSTPFLDLRSLVGVDQFQGIWSIAFSPDYINNRYFYVLYTDKHRNTTLARYKTSNTNPNLANPNSGVILLNYPKAGVGLYGNLVFGRDGYLYVTLGAGANNSRSQDGKTDFGKMLRMNVDVQNAPYYKIPADNPFVNDPDVLDEIWALGLRNAWRYSFDRNTGDMWIADVGEDSVDEVDFRTPSQGLKGSNFGWDCYEGTRVNKTRGCLGQHNYVFPIFQYHHDQPKSGECIIGGYVYRGSAYPALKGYYICVDFLSANAWKIKSNGRGGWNVYFQGSGTPKGIASFGEGENGELYAVSQTKGIFYKLQATALIASIGSTATAVGASNNNFKSYVYPTFVSNGTVILELKEGYSSVRVINMSGQEIMKEDISGILGTRPLHLPHIDAGMYIIQLVGNKTMQQKIYVTK